MPYEAESKTELQRFIRLRRDGELFFLEVAAKFVYLI